MSSQDFFLLCLPLTFPCLLRSFSPGLDHNNVFFRCSNCSYLRCWCSSSMPPSPSPSPSPLIPSPPSSWSSSGMDLSQFVQFHRPQLQSSGVPEAQWETLFNKLKDSVSTQGKKDEAFGPHVIARYHCGQGWRPNIS